MTAQAYSTEVDAQSRAHSAVVWVVVVTGEIDFLAVVLVLLLLPLDAHVVDMINCEVVDVAISEATFAVSKEGEVVPGEGKGWGARPFSDDGVV